MISLGSYRILRSSLPVVAGCFASLTAMGCFGAIGGGSGAQGQGGGGPELSEVPTSMPANSEISVFATGSNCHPCIFAMVSDSTGGATITLGGYLATGPNVGAVKIKAIDTLGNVTESSEITVYAAIVLTPTTKTMVTNSGFTFTASGGSGALTFSKTSGGGTIHATTGLFTAPATAGTSNIRVTDANNFSESATITVVGPVVISPSTKTLTVDDTFTFTASGGVPPYTYSLPAGTGSVHSTAGIYKAPAIAGGTDTVRVTDAIGSVSNATVSIQDDLQIEPASIKLAITNTKTFTISGGVAPFTFSKIAGSGSIHATTGLYTASTTTGVETVRVTDSLGGTSDATITVNPALAISAPSFFVFANNTLVFSATGGDEVYAFTVQSGIGSVTVGGTYTAPNSLGSATVKLTDSYGNIATMSIDITEQVTASNHWSCNLRANGGVKCWGEAATGQLGQGNTFDKGDDANEMGALLLAIRFGAGRSARRTEVSNTSSVTDGHACVILDDASLKCWGNNSNGQLGYGTTDNRGDNPNEMNANIPAIGLGAGRSAKRVAVGNLHTCAILDNNTLKCWGSNFYGQLGLGLVGGSKANDLGDGANEMDDNLSIVNLGAGLTAKEVIAGEDFTCVLRSNNTVVCWGRSNEGQLGNGGMLTLGTSAAHMGDNLVAVNFGTGRYALSLDAGVTHSCAVLDNDELKCWGGNSNGKLGLGDSANRGDGGGEMGDSLPAVDLGSGARARKVTAGGEHTCVILSGNDVKCWGLALNGQLGSEDEITIGDGANEMGDALNSVFVSSSGVCQDIAAGYDHTCAFLSNGEVKCWGDGASGALGQGDTNDLGDGAGEMGDSLPAVVLQ